MATRSLPRRKAKSSRTAAGQKELAHIKRAADQIDAAIRSLRIAKAMFGDEGDENAAVSDVRHIANLALDDMRKAARELFEIQTGIDTAASNMAADVLVHLYDHIDVVTVLCFALVGGEYPSSSGPTHSPTKGALSAVQWALVPLFRKLTVFLDQAEALPGDRGVAAAARGETANA